MCDTQLPGAVRREKTGELAGVQVVAVIQDAGILGRDNLFGGKRQVAGFALWTYRVGKGHLAPVRPPVLSQRKLIEALRRCKRMIVVLVLPVLPAAEPRALLEARIALPDEFGFRDTDLLEGQPHRRPGTLADPDRAHIRRLDQYDPERRVWLRAVLGREQARRQPSGRTAADDYHCIDRLGHRIHAMEQFTRGLE